MSTISNSTNTNSIAKYVVSSDGSTSFSTIGRALSFAIDQGDPANIYIRPGVYAESLNFSSMSGIYLIAEPGSVTITLPSTVGVSGTGTLSFNGFIIEAPRSIIFSSTPSIDIQFLNCTIDIGKSGSATSYLFSATAGWTGSVLIENCNDISTIRNGIMSDTLGQPVTIKESKLGIGIDKFEATGTGKVTIKDSTIGCLVEMGGTGGVDTFEFENCRFEENVEIFGGRQGSILHSSFITGAIQPLLVNGSAVVDLADVTIDTSNADAIAGTGTVQIGSITFLNSSNVNATLTTDLTTILKTGQQIEAENIQNMMFSGRLSWSGAGVYYSLAATNFTIARGGIGYVKGKQITWAGAQSTGALSVGNTHFVYMDSDGIIGSTTTRNLALFQDNIVLFEVFVDPNSVVSVVREDHPYDFNTAVSEWAHDVLGPVIANKTQGANITLNGTKAIQINGADELEDHGLETDIPDSGGAAVSFVFMFTNGAGKWEIDSTANTFASEYNNAGAVAALGANKYGIFRLYVSKDDLNTATPVYYAVLDDAQYNNLTAANTAIALNTPAGQSNELAKMELAQLGFVVKAQSTDTIVNVVIEKDTGGGSTSSASASVASLVTTDVTNFNGLLSASDTTVQAALETLDDAGGGLPWSVVTVNASLTGDTGTIANKAGLLTMTLPATGVLGEVIRITGINTAVGWRIAQNANQIVHFGIFSTTTGAGGYLESTAIRDSVELVCVVAGASSEYNVLSPVGNITVN